MLRHFFPTGIFSPSCQSTSTNLQPEEFPPHMQSIRVLHTHNQNYHRQTPGTTLKTIKICEWNPISLLIQPIRLEMMGFLSSSEQTVWKYKSWFGACPECWTNNTCLICKQLQNLIFTQGFAEMRKACLFFLDGRLWFKWELIWENPLVCIIQHARLND